MGGLCLWVVELEPAGDGGSADGGGEEDVLAHQSRTLLRLCLRKAPRVARRGT